MGDEFLVSVGAYVRSTVHVRISRICLYWIRIRNKILLINEYVYEYGVLFESVSCM